MFYLGSVTECERLIIGGAQCKLSEGAGEDG